MSVPERLLLPDHGQTDPARTQNVSRTDCTDFARFCTHLRALFCVHMPIRHRATSTADSKIALFVGE